jgi:lipoprotein-releasing system permease protein
MQGSERDFIKRLVDNFPHITVFDEFRDPRPQPLYQRYTKGAVALSSVKLLREPRGIRGYEEALKFLRSEPGVIASPVLSGQVLITSAGKDYSVTLYGMIPKEIKGVSTIEDYMVEGTIDDLIANPDGIVVGHELAKKLVVQLGDNIAVTAPSGQFKVFKLLGIFRTGRSDYDQHQTFISLKRAQAILNRPNRVNSLILKLSNPIAARKVAADLEARIGYKAVSWQEQSEDLINTLAIRNTIMYTVVSAVLIVAAFGIYNVISTVVMEKQRDIAILKSMGFISTDIKRIFLIQGIILGVCGCILGVPLGMSFMYGLMQIRFKPPGVIDPINMPIDWDWVQFAIAIAFAIFAAVAAALLPSGKAARVRPVEILRGGF